ncbi:hypothetical protein [Brevibacillus massiliensis]|uniref:hypothetical protein n=1 Tax=Brevibacillus massiliensis TaxID=1118054 RepID=UPI0002FE0722|nr:hypothetical protein [Brevibacillus massiliensis]
MDLERMLQQFKQTADETIFRDIRDTTALEKRIRSKLREQKKSRLGKAWPAGIAAAAALICFLWLPGSIVESPTDPGRPAVPGAIHGGGWAPPSDQEIAEKVDELKQQMQIGMTQEQVKELLGPPDYVVQRESGDIEKANEFWNYSYFKQTGYEPAQSGFTVDEEGLRTRKVGANLFLSWTWKEQKLHQFSLSYAKGKDVMLYSVNPDGTVKEENLTHASPEETVERGPFTLDLQDGQKQRYEEFAKTKQDKALDGLAPLDIIKMYYYAKEMADYETQYALYYQDHETEIPSRQEFLQDLKTDTVGAENSRAFIKELREHGKQYSINRHDENRAVVWIRFDNKRKPLGFQLKKTPNGVWKVCWLPIQ